MTANSPVTMQDLVNGLKFTDTDGDEWSVKLGDGGVYRIINDANDQMNAVSISSNGLTVSFGEYSGGPTYTGFTFNV